MRRISVKTMFLLVEAGAAVSMLALSFFLSAITGQGWMLLAGALLTACALVWLFLLTLFFAKSRPEPKTVRPSSPASAIAFPACTASFRKTGAGWMKSGGSCKRWCRTFPIR